MACFKNKTKHTCSKVVIVISVLSLLMGLITALYGFAMAGAGGEYTSQYGDFDVKGGQAFVTIIGGIFCIVVGVLGLLTGKFKKPIFTIPFIVLAFLIAILLFAGAAVMGGGEEDLKKIVSDGCNTSLGTQFDGKTTSELFKEQYLDLVDRWVCSDTCPCPESVKGTWEAYS